MAACSSTSRPANNQTRVPRPSPSGEGLFMRSPERDVEPVLRLRARAEGAPLRLVDLHVVDAGLPARHQALGAELPQFIAVAAVPLAAGVAALVLKAHGHPVLPKAPQAL